ncbi:EAL domain-containing protein [Rhizobium sp. CG5]|uniref:putative bifunctional diguanylate cyclase/phosphodiesterase n=1 Tax=Rhizobium sp. CG5 TaxID=2726076 RepID=UPI00203370EF|nr:EAL domain-containing protein [Rhizobium sp. CG5]MCM2474101.1 EAL domain-containing protein [Rhizobium sp. CG5]
MLLTLQNSILEMIARGEPLNATIDRLCNTVEETVAGIVCSVLSVDAQGLLHPLSAPSLPAHYSAALDGIRIGPCAGSCGTAAYRGRPVIVTDIENDPLWADYKSFALPLGFRACWSTPIISSGRVTGTFAFYFKEKRGPSEIEERMVAACVHLCAIALERNERVNERQRLAYTDVLTGLPNRAHFNLVLAEQGVRCRWGILLADMDNLKLVNDTFGHGAGDDLIKAVAHRIASVGGSGLTFRLGGDEFAIIVKNTDTSKLASVAADILQALKEQSVCGGHVVFPAATLGGAVASADEAPDQVRQNADYALYHAKERNRGQYIEFVPGLGTAITRRFRAIHDVSLALSEGRIDAHYQPIVRLETGEVVGFEALCRMITKTGDIVSAAHFQEAMKDAHVAAQLTFQMLQRVATDMRRWLDLDLPLQHVGVNLSAADFHNGSLLERLSETFGKAGVPLKHLILEVTESVYLGQRDHVVADEIKALRQHGLRVALDDFGTGFASLTHLLTVPVDIIKIDKSFIDRLVPGDGGSAIVEGLLGIAEKLGIRVVAEGIETNAQVHQLLALGCRLGQGYYYSKAVDREAAVMLLKRFGQSPRDDEPQPLVHPRRSAGT